MTKTYRIVICVDVDAESLEQAYGKVYDFMGSAPDGVDWESSDEAFDADGESVDLDVLQAARMAFFAKRNIDKE